jgi:hypothetical protein
MQVEGEAMAEGADEQIYNVMSELLVLDQEINEFYERVVHENRIGWSAPVRDKIREYLEKQVGKAELVAYTSDADLALKMRRLLERDRLFEMLVEKYENGYKWTNEERGTALNYLPSLKKSVKKGEALYYATRSMEEMFARSQKLAIEEGRVTLQLSDGKEIYLPLSLLPYFGALHAMVTDMGEGVIPLSSAFGDVSFEGLRWLIAFYMEYQIYVTDTTTDQEERRKKAFTPTREQIATYHLSLPLIYESLMPLPLLAMLQTYQFAHLNESRAAELLMEGMIFRRLLDEEEVLGVTNLIDTEDVHLWRDQSPQLVAYILLALPYARRYREVLTFVRDAVPFLAPLILTRLAPPTLTPVVCGGLATLIITPLGLFEKVGSVQARRVVLSSHDEGSLISLARGPRHAVLLNTSGVIAYGDDEQGQLGHPQYDTLTKTWCGDLGRPLAVSCGERFTMLITTEGLFASGYNQNGALGVGDFVNRKDFTRVAIQGRPISLSCKGRQTMVITTEGLFTCPYLTQLEVDFKTASTKAPLFQKLEIRGTPQTVVCGAGHAMLLTTEGRLFARGSNMYGQLGLSDDHGRSIFKEVRVPDSERPLAMACGNNHTMILTVGSLFACGENHMGQLGLGHMRNRTGLVRVTIRGEPISVACAADHTALLTTAGLFMCGDAQATGDAPPWTTVFREVVVEGLPLLLPPSSEEPTKKKQRLGCRVCRHMGTSAVIEEVARPDRVFCSTLCQRKYHHFDRAACDVIQ